MAIIKCHRGIVLLAITLLETAVTGCANYPISVNERPIVTTRLTIEAPNVPDAPLSACINQSLRDAKAQDLVALSVLNCSYNEIKQLEGIQQLQGLEQLSLRANKLQAIAILSQLPNLVWLDLSENPEIECSHIDLIHKTLSGIEIIAPQQCSNDSKKGIN